MSFNKIVNKIKDIDPNIKVSEEKGCIVLLGEVDSWDKAVKAGQTAVNKKYLGVINDIKLKGFVPTKEPILELSTELEGKCPDVLVIGAGITGSSCARELSRYNMDILLIDKGPDVADGASKANGGVVHVGINFKKDSLKHHYNLIGNGMYEELCKTLDVPFERKGQFIPCCRKWEKLLMNYLAKAGEKKGIHGSRYLNHDEFKMHEPNIPDFYVGGLYMPIGGITSPYEMTIAMAESAVINGAKLSLNTRVLSMDVTDGHINSVTTNKGTIYPKVVVNASGVHAHEIADMAHDRTFTIHGRRGTDIILDKKTSYMVNTSMAKQNFSIAPYEVEELNGQSFKLLKLVKKALKSGNHTKGVGLIHTVHGNTIIGPNAIDTPDIENKESHLDEVNEIVNMQMKVVPGLKPSDVITCFTGVRAPTYEEDFVVRKGIFTDNILEACGIQSPGVTAAPAIAIDIAKWTADMLEVSLKDNFIEDRKAPPRLKGMTDEERNEFIKKNPDYGVMICRCEEISKGEIIDALNSPICVPTLDGIKRRVRPGMGRCQGGFCSPLVTQIIAEHEKENEKKVRKSTLNSEIIYDKLK